MKEPIVKVCKHHGKTEFVLRSDGYSRCKKCAIDAVSRRRKKLKVQAVKYKGGQCSICGYDRCIEALEFHHRDPNKKDFGIGGNGATRAWSTIKKELDKCDMVCSNCHKEIHSTPVR